MQCAAGCGTLSSHPSRLALQMEQLELPPKAPPKPPAEPPKPLDEAWVGKRRTRTMEMLDWLCDPDIMPNGKAYLTSGTHHDTLEVARRTQDAA